MIRFIIMSTLLLSFMATSSEAGWLIYHKPEFRGRVIDAETKEPIEGAVVVVVYNKFLPGLSGTGGNTLPMKAKETLTDKNGEFHFPSYTTLIQPLSVGDDAYFIIYKAGYGSWHEYHGSGPFDQVPPSWKITNQELFFSKEIGSTGEIETVSMDKGYHVIMAKAVFGIVELPKLKTRDDRLKAARVGVTGYYAEDLPLLHKALDKEYESLGIRRK